MSADNYMAVKKIDEKWHVWMVLGGYYEHQWTTPSGAWHKEFENEMDAHHYAHKVCSEEVVEYGVVLLTHECEDQMCDEDYWRKEAERLFSLADVAKIKRDFLVFQRDEARHIARVLCKYLRKIEKAYDSSGDYGILDINLHDLFIEAKRELPWL